ncbi:MAG: hypothetical protein H6630_00030, partial [Arcobacter sp.]|nr:hypothetical protein [Arcobacter sp.]
LTMFDSDILWKPLLEAAGQALIGTLGSLAFGKVITQIRKRDLYEGPMDLWNRGIRANELGEGSNITIDGVISPFTQLFPGDPFMNAKRWNELYSFEGKITKNEYQAMEFFAGSDAALRVGSFNGETLVGIYARYGFIGEGIIAVVPTKLIKNKITNFFEPNFYGARATISATLTQCPSQIGYVAQTIALRSGIELNTKSYANLWYLKIKKIELFKNKSDKIISLLGSPWALTEKKNNQYLVQYGYFSDESEVKNCVDKIQKDEAWKYSKVYYDDIKSPSPKLSFKYNYML